MTRDASQRVLRTLVGRSDEHAVSRGSDVLVIPLGIDGKTAELNGGGEGMKMLVYLEDFVCRAQQTRYNTWSLSHIDFNFFSAEDSRGNFRTPATPPKVRMPPNTLALLYITWCRSTCGTLKRTRVPGALSEAHTTKGQKTSLLATKRGYKYK